MVGNIQTIFSITQYPLVGQGLVIIEVSRSHTDTPRSVGFLWTNDQPDAESSSWQHTTLIRDRHIRPPWNSKAQSQQASGRNPRLRPRGHWDRSAYRLHSSLTTRGDITLLIVICNSAYNFLHLITSKNV